MLKTTSHAWIGKALALILPVITQWTSHFLSIRRLLELELTFTRLRIENEHELIVCAGSETKAVAEAKTVVRILKDVNFWATLRE